MRVPKCDKMKVQEGGFSAPSFLPRLSFEKQITLLKLCVLSIAAILCKCMLILSKCSFKYTVFERLIY